MSETETLFRVGVLTNYKVPKLKLTINGVPTKTLIDTGSSINIIRQDVKNGAKAKTKANKHKSVRNKPLTIKGKYTFTVET